MFGKNVAWLAAGPALTNTFPTPDTFSWTAPAGVTEATIEVFGAQGGNGRWVTSGSIGGNSGSVVATFSVTAGMYSN